MGKYDQGWRDQQEEEMDEQVCRDTQTLAQITIVVLIASMLVMTALMLCNREEPSPPIATWYGVKA